MRKLTTKEFIGKAKLIHDNKYNYSLVDYKNNKIKIKIICNTHGLFLQRPSQHLSGSNCPKCMKILQVNTFKQNSKNKTKSTKTFIQTACNNHNNKYNYSKVDYKNSYTKVIIICPEHGDFLQRPNNHLAGQRCKLCSNNQLTTQSFIQKANKIHNNKYNYSLINYFNTNTSIEIICPIHGKFLQQPRKHLCKSNCPSCQKETTRLTQNNFIQRSNKIHNNKYDYSLTNYKNCRTKIIIICPKHGKFKQLSATHLNGSGCLKCGRNKTKISKSSIKWLEKIEKENNIKLEKEFPLIINNKQLFIDGFDPQTNTCYEYNGNYWHGSPSYYNPNDIHPVSKITYGKLYQKTLKREELIKQAGYNLITKWGN